MLLYGHLKRLKPKARRIFYIHIILFPLFLRLVIDCGEAWHQYRTGCVRLFDDHKTRQQARTYCQGFQTSNSVQGNLVNILSQADNDRIVSLASVQGIL